MKNLVLFLICTFGISFAHASSKTFTASESWGRAEQSCIYAHGDCSQNEIENRLQARCYESGYSTCETTVKKVLMLKSGNNGFCGRWATGKCIVTVVGQ